MIFDKFCKITERKISNNHAMDHLLLKDLKLFWFEKNAHELKRIVDDDSIYLPFQITGIEDSASFIILIDENLNQVGPSHKRYFIEVLSSHTVSDGFNDNGKFDALKRIALESDEIVTIVRGMIDSIENYGKTWKCQGSVLEMDIINFRKLKIINRHYNLEEMADYALRNAMAALEEMAYLNSSGHYVLEDGNGPLKENGNRILRSHERPKYIMKP